MRRWGFADAQAVAAELGLRGVQETERTIQRRVEAANGGTKAVALCGCGDYVFVRRVYEAMVAAERQMPVRGDGCRRPSCCQRRGARLVNHHVGRHNHDMSKRARLVRQFHWPIRELIYDETDAGQEGQELQSSSMVVYGE